MSPLAAKLKGIMKKVLTLLLSLVLVSAQPSWAQPSLTDILQGGQIRLGGGQRGNSDLEKAIAIGSILYQIHQSRKGQVRHPSPSRRAPSFPTRSPRRAPAPAPRPEPVVNQVGRPSGYDYIAVSGKTLRLDPKSLPLSINPGRPDQVQTVQKAVDLWNSAGLGTLFTVTHGTADITVDWSGRNVSPGARAETRMKTSSRVVIPESISVKEGGKSRYHLARVMTHELGHVLGLDHSSDPSDIMYRSEGRGDLVLTARDTQMLKWLYSQNSYVPVVGATRQSGTATSYALRGSSFCGHRHH